MDELDAALLSAYLDGELDDRQARKVEARLEADPAARSELEALKRLDSRWRDQGSSAAFRPAVRLPRAAPGLTLGGVFAIAAALVLGRLLTKAWDAVPVSVSLNLIAFVVVIAALLLAARAASSEDHVRHEA